MKISIQPFDMVMALYIFGVITAEVLGIKTVPLVTIGGLSLHATVAIIVMPLLFTMVDVVIEVYGRARARSMVWCGLTVVALLLGYAAIAVALPPSAQFASMEPAFDSVFGASIRIAAASLVAFAAAEFLDVALFSKLRSRMGNQALWLRNNVTNFVAQFVDSAVFMILAFYVLDLSIGANATMLIGLILPYWLIRCGLSVLETPLVYLGVWILRRTPDKQVAALKEVRA